ncbi:hypothetical protein [Flavobacterium sp. GSB-24]|uniref:hypothetical protein n=1 Tax=Flavobacterium sp. GSB-24 TaxID=2994319 RepID=UPI0024928E8E|nr:hypothetical protein [Flavobacterium sp. GSB-24]BDU27226.1 hypothetical protein FLGSB24_39700 [Flavobacterium sp. GSB-24]
MLRSYKYIETSHRLLNENIIAFFNRIELETGDYSTTFFDLDFYNDIVSHHKKILEEPLKAIFEIIKNWEQGKRTDFCNKIRESNDIERICSRVITPLKISEIDREITDIVDIKKLFSDLYKQVLYGNHCKVRYGDMQEHFNLFKTNENEIFKCPVCGLIPQNTGGEKKEDYDHLLPYTIYPFSSINFKNLAPICVDCNSDYKEDKDVLDNGGKKIFYYYDHLHQGITIDAKLENEGEHTFSFNYSTIDDRREEIESWNEIFDINTRYVKRAKGKADKWFRHYWEFLEDPTYKHVDIDTKKNMYSSIYKKDPDTECIKSPVIVAMENSKLSLAYQESARYKMNF